MIIIYEDTNGDQYRIKNVKDMIYNPDQEEFIITFKNDKFMNIWRPDISFVACKDKGARKCTQ